MKCHLCTGSGPAPSPPQAGAKEVGGAFTLRVGLVREHDFAEHLVPRLALFESRGEVIAKPTAATTITFEGGSDGDVLLNTGTATTLIDFKGDDGADLLINAGLSPSALSIAVVVTLRDEVHAVLLLSTDQGEYVLDSLSNSILPWEKAGYRWRQRQVAGSVTSWAMVATAESTARPRRSSRGVLLASVR